MLPNGSVLTDRGSIYGPHDILSSVFSVFFVNSRRYYLGLFFTKEERINTKISVSQFIIQQSVHYHPVLGEEINACLQELFEFLLVDFEKIVTLKCNTNQF